MSNGVIPQALQRQQDRPDIHKSFDKPKGSVGYSEDVFNMVRDLKEHVPVLSHRQLSTLVGIGTKQVRIALDNPTFREADETWTTDDNETRCADELAALHEHHPGRKYEDDTRAKDEPTRPVSYFTAPEFRDVYRRADQSHTIKRPITLATSPFNVAA